MHSLPPALVSCRPVLWFDLMFDMMRTVPNARRLATAMDSAEEQSRLAHAVCRDHMASFARMGAVLILQLIARWA